ncbi:hypothetical protein [Streptomyces sp. NPDC001594]|uniref:hypothetical protein n=1 Tax=Streptomyces sp. NPDC001594 TaxID=3364590 RepID=UPI0036B2F741
MPYILLGRGSLEADTRCTPGPEETVIPRGTTLHCLTAEQGLFLGLDAPDIWDQLAAPWPSFGGGIRVPNLTLYGLGDVWEGDAQFDGYTLVEPGSGGRPDPVLLCTDTLGACPTTQEEADAGATHPCDGALGLPHADDLYWIAAFAVFTWVERTFASEGSLQAFAEDTLRGLLQADRQALTAANRDALRAAGRGRVLHCVVSASAFAVGAAHDHPAFAAGLGDHAYCSLSVVPNDSRRDRGSPEGWLLLEDVPPNRRRLVAAELARCSPYQVRFR